MARHLKKTLMILFKYCKIAGKYKVMHSTKKKNPNNMYAMTNSELVITA